MRTVCRLTHRHAGGSLHREDGSNATIGATTWTNNIVQRGRQGDATPLHVHRREAEVFYVIEGVITTWAGEARTRLGSEGAVYLPAGLPHALRVDSEQARIITLTAPAGFADFVHAAAVRSDGDVPAAWEFDVERIMAAAPHHGIDIVGPPPRD